MSSDFSPCALLAAVVGRSMQERAHGHHMKLHRTRIVGTTRADGMMKSEASARLPMSCHSTCRARRLSAAGGVSHTVGICSSRGRTCARIGWRAPPEHARAPRTSAACQGGPWPHPLPVPRRPSFPRTDTKKDATAERLGVFSSDLAQCTRRELALKAGRCHQRCRDLRGRQLPLRKLVIS